MKYFKKHPFQLIAIAIAILIIAIVIYNQKNYRPPTSNTTSYIEILEIGSDDRDPWTIVKNPYDSKAVPFKLSLDSYNTKNLLDVGNTYLATYETNLKTKKSVLLVIKQPAEVKEPNENSTLSTKAPIKK
ncbi:hypothetical protein [Paenibacillus sp. Soil787]|uniref:hypothetical protein n=1 Tax=Paenibacillus sp. Soil787 TaxID=1736411 RepID=UPI0007036962|nr:hypothetical protein [Paenibacillus sp. Soil787]KRF20053.1 hypothetical protein ASG93_31655 [Paenibacillus sp. Soil787]